MENKYRLLAKPIIVFVIVYLIPFTTVITLMIHGELSVQIGIQALLTLVLLYLTAFQVEIALRNSALRELEVQVLLRIILKEGYVRNKNELKEVVLKNEGKYPAKMIIIDIITDPPIDIEKYRYETLKDMLIPGEEIKIMDYRSSLKDYKIQINVMYVDVMDKERHIMFIKPKGYELFVPIGAPVNLEKGIFIKTLENIELIKNYLKLRKYKQKQN